LYEDLNKGEDGYILKRNVFSKIFNIHIANWYRAILTEMQFNLKFEMYKEIPKYLKMKLSSSKKLEEEVNKVGDVCDILASYCQYWWQVQISAQLGEGLWEKVPEFQEYVLTHDYDDYTPKINYTFTERNIKLASINIKYDVVIHKKDDATKVMAVLEKENAIITELLYVDYKLHKTKLIDIFKNGISLSKQRKSKSPSPRISRKRKSSKDIPEKNTKYTRKRV
jgi:hypothetical protein